MMDVKALIDAHVHHHGFSPPEEFFSGALRNFRQTVRRLGLRPDSSCCLFLAEPAGRDDFRRWRDGRLEPGADRWRTAATREECSLLVCRDGEPKLILIAGRQIATRENLEVLALGSSDGFPDGEPADATIERVLAAGAIAVLPWGFGKWWGSRGRIVRRLIEDAGRRGRHGRFFLGDNGGRPRLAPDPRPFREARRHGIGILAGSDPLPFPGRGTRAGAYGSTLPGTVDPETPFASVSSLLGKGEGRFPRFGRGETLLGFARDQAAMQWRRRLR
jgi:hypothetical protein